LTNRPSRLCFGGEPNHPQNHAQPPERQG
jgi:hypothetical protein